MNFRPMEAVRNSSSLGTPQINIIFKQLILLPLISKVFERVIFDQPYNYMNKFLNS